LAVEKIIGQRAVCTSSHDGPVKAKAAGDAEEATRIVDQVFVPASTSYQDSLRELVAMQRTSIDDTTTVIDRSTTASRRLMALLTATEGSADDWKELQVN
jgi:methyl-accepting chemotaxis protein